MALNKFMHPRNKYRKPPDFKALAIKYSEFRKIAKQDISGKVSLNFKDSETLRVLTHTLLKEDFNLDVDIPQNRLVPTLPLRLNYLLWIEDLLVDNKRTSDIKGVDIGCGASCVYPLLAARHFGWHMIATEVDIESAFIASYNVKKNNLQNMIRVRPVKEGQMLEGLLQPNTVYDFCMCNPPFFSSVEELDPQNVSRSPNRPPPRNAHSGSPGELVVPGGEIAFVNSIIKESVKLKDTVRIYTVMVGHKSSVSKVHQSLQEAGVTVIANSKFCQGHTTRWGVAWTLDPNIVLKQVKEPKSKKNTPFCHTFDSDLPSTVERLKQLLEQLQITYTILKSSEAVNAMQITAKSNTWLNLRKKRRQEKFKEITAKDDNKGENSEIELKEPQTDELNSTEEDIQSETVSVQNLQKDTETKNMGDTGVGIIGENEKETTDCENDKSSIKNTGEKHSLDEEENGSCSSTNPRKKAKLDDTKADPVLQASLVVKKSSEGCSVKVYWLRGSGGKDAVYQVLQYLKNQFKPH